jgi:hypothetical protein
MQILESLSHLFEEFTARGLLDLAIRALRLDILVK